MSTGIGIEWITPIGPLQLVFAKPLNDKKVMILIVLNLILEHAFNERIFRCLLECKFANTQVSKQYPTK